MDRLEKFGAYVKACQLWNLCWDDCERLDADFRGHAIAQQLIRSVGSISANMEEGYGRGYGKELAQFLRTSRASARESRGWYYRARRLLPVDILQVRYDLIDEVISILVSTINRLENRK
jgi:four helix bundle protein